MLNTLTIDVEEYFQVHNFESVVERSEWDSYPSRVEWNVRRILGILAQYGTHATFFVLGWVADRHPDLIREIAQAGHEIATHGYEHQLVYRQDAHVFAADLAKSIESIEGAFSSQGNGSKLRLMGYRAPAFSVTSESMWALDVMREHGLLYDSSIFPLAAHDRYGIRDASRFASRIRRDLWEFPVSTVRLGRRNWPVAGGGYFRLFPLCVTRRAIRHINDEGHPAVVYLHPWEFDPEQPQVRRASPLARFRHYVNLHKTEVRLCRLLETFSFGPVRDVFADCLGGIR